MSALAFFVPGEPIPKGSWRHVGRGRLVPDNDRSVSWEQACAGDAMVARARSLHQTLDGSVVLFLRFLLTRPRTVKRPRPNAKPDLDKLVRGVKDALTRAGVYTDDSRVTLTFSSKLWAIERENGGRGAGVIVDVLPASELTTAMVVDWLAVEVAREN